MTDKCESIVVLGGDSETFALAVITLDVALESVTLESFVKDNEEERVSLGCGRERERRERGERERDS
jgi:hypothetical protein